MTCFKKDAPIFWKTIIKLLFTRMKRKIFTLLALKLVSSSYKNMQFLV
jgi:hypothetical protein